MEPIVERCCGLDVHQATVVACLLVGSPDRRPRKVIRKFRTMRAELEELRQWLLDEGCTHVAMESTGIYWMPVYTVLEGHLRLVVGNATHIKNVPGRKTDVKDSEWIADLLRHGLIRPSFVPPKPLRQLRDLLRYRRKLVDAQSAERNRLQRLLETAGIKLASVMSDLFGASGRAMVRALLKGELTAAQIAELARGSLRSKKADLTLALGGDVEEHHRFILEMQLRRLDNLARDIAELDERVDLKLQPYRTQQKMLMEIPGVDRVGAATIIAELGVDMSVFPTAGHAAAFAGVCPGSYQSGGKRRKGEPVRKGNIHLTTALVQAAICAAQTKGTYLRAKYWRLKARRGPKRAAVAVAHKILIAAYHMLGTGTVYTDLGDTYLDQRNAAALKKSLIRKLQGLGYEVSLQPRVAA